MVRMSSRESRYLWQISALFLTAICLQFFKSVSHLSCLPRPPQAASLIQPTGASSNPVAHRKQLVTRGKCIVRGFAAPTQPLPESPRMSEHHPCTTQARVQQAHACVDP